jgi:tetratricopeptide (TPR) repeat protein
MRNFFYFLSITSFTVFIVSCGGGGKGTGEFAPVGIPEIDKITEVLMQNQGVDSLWAERGYAFYDAAENDANNAQLYDFSIRDFQRAIQLDSNKLDYYHGLADAQLDFNQSQAALKTLQLVLQRAPGRVSTLLKLSEMQLIVKQYAQSMGSAMMILEKSPNNADANFMVGRIMKEQGDTINALTAFQKAVQANSDHFDAYMQLGLLCAEQRKPLALQYYDNALRIDSLSTEALYAKAMYYQEQAQPDVAKAMAIYKKIVAIDPQYTEAFFNIGVLQLDQNQTAAAKTNFALSTKTDPTCGRCFYYRAVVAEKEGDIAAAKQFLEQAAKLEPENESIKKAIESLSSK